MKISKDQFEAFETPTRAKWISESALRLHHAYSNYFEAFAVQPRDLEPLCRDVERWAAGHGISGERDVSQLFCVATTLGHRFWLDPKFRRYLDTSVQDIDLDPSRAVQELVSHTSSWLATLWAGDTLAAFSERLSHHIRQGSVANPQTLQAILPGHWVALNAGQNDKYLAWLKPRLPAARTAPQELAYVGCALVHGADWVSDPQFAKLAACVAGAMDPSDLAAKISAIYGGMS